MTCLRDVWPPRVGDIFAEGCTARSFDSSVLITAVAALRRGPTPAENWCEVDIIAVRHVYPRGGSLSGIEVLRGISVTYLAAWILLHRIYRVGDEAP